MNISNPILKHLKLIQCRDNRTYVKYILPTSLEIFEYEYIDSTFFNIIKNLKNLKKLNLISNIKRNINESVNFKIEKFAELTFLEKISFTNYTPNNVLDIIKSIPNLNKVSFNYFENIFYPNLKNLKMILS